MTGNIQIEVLNESAAMVALHLKDVSDFDKQVLVMHLANALDLTPDDVLLTSIMYPASSPRPNVPKRIYRTTVLPLTYSPNLYPAIGNPYWTTTQESATMNASTGGTPT